MKKYISAVLLLLVLISCDSETSSTGNYLLPDATGGSDELMVFVNDSYFSEDFAKTIKKMMVEPYKILPQSEARFSVSTVAFSKINTILKRFRNPIYIVVKGDNSEFAKEINSALTEEEKKNIEQQESSVLYRNNLWASEQSAAIIFVSRGQDIISSLEKYKPELEKYFDNSNLKFYSKLAYINGVNASLNKQFQEYHNFKFDVPVGYVLAKNEKNMVLLRKDEDKCTLFLAIDVMEYNAEIPLNNLGISKFDELGKFLDGEKENSYVIADTTLGFTEEIIEENGLVKYENGGLWVMQNDLVGGGPFINQYIIDNSKNRVIYLSGMVYGPAEKHKKKYMRQFEAIFNSLMLD